MHKILIMTDFGIKLQQWYRVNKRILPWRLTRDPYKVWLSEIILQQTQVVQGTSYYLKFVEKYPDVQGLAKASEEEVLRLWQGLGYYSRARNLHASAQFIVNELGGVFPRAYSDIIKLKGVGAYTAAAISSFCFDEPHAAIDGNVYRFISRLKGIRTAIDTTEGKKEFAMVADELLNRTNPGEHNQAMIEFGALVCRPVNPSCQECPFNDGCLALAQNSITELPVKSKKVKQRKRYFHYFLVEKEGGVYLNKRTDNDIWKNLYELPLLEVAKKTPIKRLVGNTVPLPVLVDEKTHVLSHQIIHASFYLADVAILELLEGRFVFVEAKALKTYPFSQLIANFINERIGVQTD